MKHKITCRAKVTDDGYDGQPTKVQFGEDLPISADGTWRGIDDESTIVCDPCFLMVMPFTKSGAALKEELEDGIRAVRGNIEYARRHLNPAELIEDAKRNMELGRPGSPLYESAKACVAIAEAEMKRR